MTDQIAQACKDLVIRARAGDQNAMALIVEVGKAAKTGSERAKISAQYIEDYCKKNPPPKVTDYNKHDWSEMMQAYVNDLQSSFTGEDFGECVIVLLPIMGQFGINTLADGPNLTNDIITQLSYEFGSELEQHAFQFGVRNVEQAERIKKNVKNLNKETAYAVLVGCCVGEARNLQLVRLPNTPVSVISKKAAEELGDL